MTSYEKEAEERELTGRVTEAPRVGGRGSQELGLERPGPKLGLADV